MTVIRSAGLRAFGTTVTELGGDPAALAARAGVPLEALHTDDLMVPAEAMATLLEVAAAELDCPDLGLRIADRQDLSMLGPLAPAVQNSPTMGEALACASRYLFVHAPSLSIGIEEDPYAVRGVVAVRYGTQPGLPHPPQATDLGLAFVHHAVRLLAGADYGLRTVELPHQPVAALSTYEDYFGVRVHTGRAAAMLRVPARLVDHPLDGADETIRRMAVSYLDAQAPPETREVVPRVRAAVRQVLGTTGADIGSVARLLAVHPRTLQRRLAEEGASYSAVVDEVRRGAARRYLTATDMPLTQVAAALGLSEQSALTRASRRWFGVTPSDVRAGREPAVADSVVLGQAPAGEPR